VKQTAPSYRQEVLFLKEWYQPGSVPKARPVVCPVEPDRVWTLFRHEDEAEPPILPMVPLHHINAFAEDYMHDWNWRVVKGVGMLDYSSRVADRPVWILLEFKEELDKGR